MFKPLRSLKSRLILWVFLPALLISFVDLLFTYNSTDKIATLVQEQLLKSSAKIMSEQINLINGEVEFNLPPAAFELFASPYQDHVYYSIRSEQGKLIAGADEIAPLNIDIPLEQAHYFSSRVGSESVRFIAYAHALPTGSAHDIVITQIAQTQKGQAAFRQELFMLTMRRHFMLLCMVLAGLMVASRWALRPLISFGEKITQRQGGSLEQLDTKDVPSELLPVISAMNDYVMRLDNTLSSYEQFVASTAHQLRTSFAVLTSQLNFGRRSATLDSTQNEVFIALQKTVAQGSKVIN
ncbi:sensor histidine kinase [Solimicrobium silvestre]|uniref:histidine kinase n=1 Tax=Solimicrobium silvestre TaxID=2099400 RepID=A0A2S9H2G5_9BURK|nr:sensor histidine kinase N-terminal domain-containing protein [Solimicrobium silvestre]PRC94150.1 Two-component sensor kinase N-terminal [Solimicrobium silvestre]